MRNSKIYIYATLLAAPFIGLLYYLSNPPQCPLEYTQAQVDASRCIVGANIGGIPFFIVASGIVLFSSVSLVKRFATRKKPQTS